eukprot:10097526-Ditylum_brightwellii.AAC.1
MNKQAEATVLKSFHYKILSKCSNATKYVELAKVRHEVYKNLTSVDSANNGIHGHLGLAMDDHTYSMWEYSSREGVIVLINSSHHREATSNPVGQSVTL